MIAVVLAAVAFATPRPYGLVTTLMLVFGLVGFGIPRPWNLAAAAGLAAALIAWMALAATLQGPFLDSITNVLHWFL